jgi:hypothetical protein
MAPVTTARAHLADVEADTARTVADIADVLDRDGRDAALALVAFHLLELGHAAAQASETVVVLDPADVAARRYAQRATV